MSYLALVIYFVAIAFWLTRWKWVKNSGIKSWVLIALFALKLLGGMAITYLYGTYYGESTDIYRYYNDAQYLKNILVNDQQYFWDVFLETNQENSQVQQHLQTLKYWSSGHNDFFIHERKPLVILNFLMSFISFGNIYIHVLWMSLIAFLGQIALFRFFKNQQITADIFVLAVVFLLPTFLLWTSTILKEPLIIFLLGFALYFMGEYFRQRRNKYLLASLSLLGLGLFIKAFVVVCLLLPLAVFAFFKAYPQISFKKQSLTVLGTVLIINLAFYAMSLFTFSIYQKMSDKQKAFYDVVHAQEQEEGKVGSLLEVPTLEPTFLSHAEQVLPAFSRVFFKPGFYDMKNILYIPDVLQNVLILLLALLIPFKLKYIRKQTLPVLWMSVLFVLIYFSIIGLVVPVLGAIVRYKIIALPFLFLFLMSFLNIQFSEKFNKLFFRSGTFKA